MKKLNINHKKYLLTVAYLFLCHFIFSQNLIIEPVLTSGVGNFGGRVNCIFQDRKGFIWIGKETGLFRFDGYELKYFRYSSSDTNSVSSNNILSIYQDSTGYLWFGTKGGGLNQYNSKTGIFNHYNSNENNPQSLSYNEIYSIFPARGDNLWIGTDGGGFNFYNALTKKFKRFRQDSDHNPGLWSNKILSFEEFGKDKLWIGTWGGGLHLFDSVIGKITHMGEGTPFSRSNIFNVSEVKPGILWLATWGQGLVAYDIKRDHFFTIIPPSEIANFRCIQHDSTGAIWVGCAAGLLYFPNPDSAYTLPENLLSFKDVTTISKDKTGTIWFGCENGSVGKINSYQKKFSRIHSGYTFSTSPVNTVLSSIASGLIYFSSGNNVIQFSPKTNQFKSFRSPYPELVSIAEIRKSNLILCASQNGFTILDPVRGLFIKPDIIDTTGKDILDKQIWTISSTDSGGYWIGALGAAYFLQSEQGKGRWIVKKDYSSEVKGSLSVSHYPASFLEDRRGNFWIGTWGGGLNRMPAGSSTFFPLRHDPGNTESLSDNFVEFLKEDQKGIIWIGTHAGLNMLDSSTSVFKHFSIKDGLSNDWINAIATDRKNRIWISTQNGISCISGNGKNIKNFDSDDGLPANSFLPRSVSEDNSGNIYFGSVKGIVWFNPDSITDNPNLPEVAITDFKINNDTVMVSAMSALQQNIEFTDKLVLNNRQSSFSFRIAPLSYFNSKKNRIKYILKGYDEGWKDAGSDRIAKYHAIPAGTYTFSAIASNEDGIWNYKETSINITITKLFWQKGWAIILFIVAMAMTGYVIWKRFRVFLPGVVSDQVRINHLIIQPSEVVLDPAEKQFFQKALKIVEENISDPDFGVNEMCDKMLISRSQLYRKIQAIGGLSVTEFIKEVRLKRAAQLLKQKSLSISEIAYSVGFNDPKYFSRCFKQQFGVSPVHFTSENERSLPQE